MTDKEVILNYRQNVIDLHSLRALITWNYRHGLPVIEHREEVLRLKESIIRFDDLINAIGDRRARNVLRCRYALGMSLPETSAFMELSCKTIGIITERVLARWS